MPCPHMLLTAGDVESSPSSAVDPQYGGTITIRYMGSLPVVLLSSFGPNALRTGAVLFGARTNAGALAGRQPEQEKLGGEAHGTSSDTGGHVIS